MTNEERYALLQIAHELQTLADMRPGPSAERMRDMIRTVALTIRRLCTNGGEI